MIAPPFLSEPVQNPVTTLSIHLLQIPPPMKSTPAVRVSINQAIVRRPPTCHVWQSGVSPEIYDVCFYEAFAITYVHRLNGPPTESLYHPLWVTWALLTMHSC
ncbi:hypothetical protein JTE90_011180 [Oedothorax gibbosus]|uniref:Uncharacterized protein n=1 Tax=Oedothorax gibbosus TaxID=931172 RepID=A0AAV6W1D2_9ARAC|nr:hypothetical protein JTE90_011180 [Oedothorax gibbosus]